MGAGVGLEAGVRRLTLFEPKRTLCLTVLLLETAMGEHAAAAIILCECV